MLAEASSHTLSVLSRNGAETQVSPTLRRRLRRWMQRVMAAAGHPQDGVCVSLSDDGELHALNLAYANEDHATDVLSFSQAATPTAPAKKPRKKSPNTPVVLGDIVVSIETAARQATAQGHPLEVELLHLCVHGFCHLLGYDHATKSEERVMFAYEALLRAEALSRRPVCLIGGDFPVPPRRA